MPETERARAEVDVGLHEPASGHLFLDVPDGEEVALARETPAHHHAGGGIVRAGCKTLLHGVREHHPRLAFGLEAELAGSDTDELDVCGLGVDELRTSERPFC